MAFHPELTAWLRSHHGIVSSGQATSLGVPRRTLKGMVASGELTVAYEGVYRHAMWPPSFLSDCVAVCAADPTLVVTCGGAARIWRYRRCTRLGLHVCGTGTGLRLPTARSTTGALCCLRATCTSGRTEFE